MEPTQPSPAPYPSPMTPATPPVPPQIPATPPMSPPSGGNSTRQYLLIVLAAIVVSLASLLLTSTRTSLIYQFLGSLPVVGYFFALVLGYPLGFSIAFEYFIGVPISVVAIPIIFAIIGLNYFKGNRLKGALYSFFAALLVAAVIILPFYYNAQRVAREEARIRCEEERERNRIYRETYPETLKNGGYISPPCE